MPHFRIYYSNSTYDGDTQQDWVNAPDQEVQVIAVFEPEPQPPNLPDRFLTGFVFSGRKDRTFYTGVDDYDPLNFGSYKYGSLLPRSEYDAIWDLAYGDN